MTDELEEGVVEFKAVATGFWTRDPFKILALRVCVPHAFRTRSLRLSHTVEVDEAGRWRAFYPNCSDLLVLDVMTRDPLTHLLPRPTLNDNLNEGRGLHWPEIAAGGLVEIEVALCMEILERRVKQTTGRGLNVRVRADAVLTGERILPASSEAGAVAGETT